MSIKSSVPAPLEALQSLLAAPPWRRRRPSPIVLDLRAPEVPVVVEWLPGEREEWLSAGADRMGVGDWARAADRLRRGEPADWREAVEFFCAGPEEMARPLLADWQPLSSQDCGSWMRRIVARFEGDALPAVKRLYSRAPAEVKELYQPFSAPDLAWRMAGTLQHAMPGTAAARAWLDRHPELAAQEFIPSALGPVSRGRRAREHALLFLVAAGHVETVRTVAKSYGPEAAAAIDVLIAGDPLAILPPKLPALPKWIDPAVLPPVRLKRPSDPEAPGADSGPGLVLPAGSARDLAMVFALHDLREPYPGLEVVREACEPVDLARFAWALFEAWQAAGANGRQGWVLDALGLVGNDETARRLTPLIMKWPGQSWHSRAVHGVQILVQIGTDVAILQVYSIVLSSRFDGLRSSAEWHFERVAERLDLTVEHLATRLLAGESVMPV
ncbi:hypothetical protein [Actinoplanes regularis]|uniref:Uncharacterized protein n=1 Tax=Actinoplanes regularis TaxID=52697 RepID=A0A239C3H4_9ACTN|nr:hypothetical protein [Actinoplanes regularis]GIE88127.1 hypothetical protein Are01nite_46070 [Actinoplanes regularis]SNS14807.1 hypothetical protein SAMN06264365_110289 [Actinoplanes regularis]